MLRRRTAKDYASREEKDALKLWADRLTLLDLIVSSARWPLAPGLDVHDNCELAYFPVTKAHEILE